MWVPPARTGDDLNAPYSDQNPAQTRRIQAVIIRFWSIFNQVLDILGVRRGKNPYCVIVSGMRYTSRSGYGVLYERQPLVCTIHVYASGLGGCSGCYATVRLDVVVVYNDNAEYQ